MATLAPPVITLSEGPTEAASEPFVLAAEIEAQGESSAVWMLDGEVVRHDDDSSLEIDPMALQPGTHTLEITVTDESDLSSSVNLDFDVAALPPVVEIDGIFADTTLSDEPISVQIDVTSQTDIDAVMVQIDGGDPQSLSGPPYTYEIDPLALPTIAQSEHNLAVRVTNAGGEAFATTIPFSTSIFPRN